MKRKCFAILLAICLIVSLFPNTVVYAADKSGTFGAEGDNLSWVLNSEGTLIISGVGQMSDPSEGAEVPWKSYKTKIKTVIVEDGVTNLMINCFSGCSNLTSVSLPDSLQSIRTWAFYECKKLSGVTVPASVTSIEAGAFGNCPKLVNIYVDSGNNTFTDLNGVLFSKDESELLAYPNGRTDSTYTVPDTTRAIKELSFAFSHNITDVTIPDSVTEIGTDVFFDCVKLASAVIPETTTSLGAGIFGQCTRLKEITLPSGITSIGPYFTYKCNKLTNVYYRGTAEQWNQVSIDNTNKGNEPLLKAHIHYADGSTEKPVNDRCGDNLTYSIKDGTLSITGTGDMWNYDVISNFPSWFMSSSIDTLKISEGVTSIGSCAFGWLLGLKTLEIPTSVISIGSDAFNNSRLIKDIYYSGTEEEWSEIKIQSGNYTLNGVNMHYNSSISDSQGETENEPDNIIENPDELPKQDVKIFYNGGEVEPFDYNLEYYISQSSSTVYNPELAHMLIALSCAAYNQSDMQESFMSLGFLPENTYYDYAENEAEDLISFSFAKKTLSNGENLVLVVVKGSSQFNWNHQDWQSNIDLGSAILGCFWHNGFELSTKEVYGRLEDFIWNDFNNTTFVVTGHSRGAAVANLLEVKLFDKKIKQSKVYGYNFACPDIATGLPTGWNWLGEHNNIFNIANTQDPVSILPGILGDKFFSAIPGNSWGKFGKSRWFSNNWNNTDDLQLAIDAHDQKEYLRFLRKKPAYNSFKTWEERMAVMVAKKIQSIGKYFAILCPVDVLISDENGTPIASVINGNTNYYNSQFGEVLIFKSGDKKSIFVQGDRPLTIQLTGTADGKMNYIVQSYDIEQGTVFDEKNFANVTLTKGKQMQSIVNANAISGTDADVSKVPLYVLDDTGKAQKEILPDGNGTEIPVTEDENAAPGDIPASSYDIILPARITGGTLKLSHASARENQRVTITATPNNGNNLERLRITDRNGNTLTLQNLGNGKYEFTMPKSNVEVDVVFQPTATIWNNPFRDVSMNDWFYDAVKYASVNNLMNGYNGAFSPREPLSRAQLAQILYNKANKPSVPTTNAFDDVVSGAWYNSAVYWAMKNQIVNGYGNRTFAPNGSITREQLAVMLWRYAGSPAPTNSSLNFSDANQIRTYALDAFRWAVGSGIINGVGNNQLNPGGTATRAQAAQMLKKYFESSMN